MPHGRSNILSYDLIIRFCMIFYRHSCLLQVQSVLEKAVEKFGRVDGVADCAGSALIKPAHLTSAEEFHDAMAQNVLSAFNILKASVRLHMGTHHTQTLT